WFIRRPEETPSLIYISQTLPVRSISPPVLKTYAYLTTLAIDNYYSPNTM
ncbi:13650_t:CDS:1, partial [Funneliformis mosseae]